MSDWITIDVDGRPMRSYLAKPAQDEAPAVLVCMHAPGVDEFMTTMCDRLAEAGFAAICPDVYHRQDDPQADTMAAMGRLVDAEVLVDLAAARDALGADTDVDGTRTGVIGFCMGGRLAYLQAANDPDLNAAVVFYGGNIMVPWGEGAAPFEQTSNIRAPVLGLFGGDDQNPSPDDVARIDAELDRCGVTHEFVSYDDAGHAFLNFVRQQAYREAQAADAWARCTAWLKQHLA